ncbi:MAG: response regulator [Acidobacteriota bacterium]|nr:response regulator [Acidobacteriota bacterium]
MRRQIFHFKPIYIELMAPLVFIGTVAIILGIWVIHTSFSSRLQRQAEARAEAIVNAVDYAAETVEQNRELRRFVEAMGAERNVNLIVVAAGNPARVISASRQALVGKPVSQLPRRQVREVLNRVMQNRSMESDRHTERKELCFAAPLWISEPHLEKGLVGGAVLVLIDTRYIRAMVNSATLRLGALLIGVLIVLLATTYALLHHLVVKPAGTIEETIRRRTAGDEKAYAPVHADDELGSVALTLNRLMDTLATQKQRFASLVANLPGITYRIETKNGVWRTTFVSDSALDMIGYPPEAFTGGELTLGSLIHPEDRERAQEILDTARDRRESWEREYRLIHRDGRELWIYERGQCLTGREGRAISLEGFLFNITSRKQVESLVLRSKEEAEAGTRAKSEFLATMSHEIRTPMNGILGMTHLLMDTELNDEQRQCASTILTSGESLLNIINDILDFSKIEAGKLSIEPIPFDLQVAISEVTELLGNRIREKGLELVVDYHDDAPRYLIGDAGRIRQILMNLLSNAVKFTETGYICIQVNCDKKTTGRASIKLAVEDTGIGIPEEAQSRLFSTFIQADSSTARRFGGTGLGLAICKQLTGLMGGEIGMESVQDVGSTFWFSLRLEVAPDPPTAWEGKHDLRGVRVLIVEDNEIHAKITTALCRKLHMEVLVANSGASALKTLEEAARLGNPVQMALIDLQMPQMDGATLGRTIKENPDLENTALILMTVFGRRGDTRRLRNDGFAAYLVKPLQPGIFEDILSMVWNAHLEKAPLSGLITRHTVAESKAVGKKRNDKTTPFDSHVLLAEDNLINQKVAVKMLSKLGCRVTVAGDGQEALDLLPQGPFDLILMDCQMPELDGYETTVHIRRDREHWGDIPIIAMTANVIEGDKERCMAIGMDDYIRKPVSPETLREVLGRFLEKGVQI